MYATMYGMKRTTIYLPDDLKARLKQVAELEGRSEADLIRQALTDAIEASGAASTPSLPLFASGQPTLSEDVDEALAGFGAT